MRALRTPVGLSTMDITDRYDYLAHEDYKELRRVLRATGWRKRDFLWDSFWRGIQEQVSTKITNLVVSRRLNSYAPSTALMGFFSEQRFLPSDRVKIIREHDLERAQAICALLNSVTFLIQFFLLKEESSGRYVDIREYDLNQMLLFPKDEFIGPLSKVYIKYRKSTFPSLRDQFDQNFNERYQEFWEIERGLIKQPRLRNVLEEPINPAPQRLDFGREICEALGTPASSTELIRIYKGYIKEMILTHGLSRD